MTAPGEPELLRRVDGASVYTVAGADPYTSRRILDAEQRSVAIAGRRDGVVVDERAVALALLEMAANRTALDAAQEALVRQMCVSGARLQLAIAPAGAGKTTAMRALTAAWLRRGAKAMDDIFKAHHEVAEPPVLPPRPVKIRLSTEMTPVRFRLDQGK
jgi:hypothetical protein